MSFEYPIGKTIFPVKPISSGCEFISGYAFKGKDFTNVGNPVVKIKNIQNGRVTTEASQFVSDDVITEKLEKFRLHNGDVLIAMTGQGSVGRVGKLYVSTLETPYLNQRVGKFVTDEKNLNIDFLYYIISAQAYENHLFAAGSGSGQPNLSPAIIKSVEIPFPPYDVQCHIGKMLKGIDEKIELNRQTNQTLEHIAQAIFKSWFVDFDPTRAKIAAKQSGQDPERAAMAAISGKALDELDQLSSEQLEQLRITAGLFPDGLVDSELGEVPEGWEFKKLKDICRVLNGRAYKNTEFREEGTPIVRIQNLSSGGKGGKTVYSDLDLPLDKLIHKEDFIYAWSATFGPHIWRGKESIYHYHIWKMDVDEDVISRYFLYLSMFRKTEQMKSGATGSIFTHLTKSTMESQEILLASHELNMVFKDMIEKYFKKISAIHEEISSLEELRDTLLPKLLSGELSTESTGVTTS